MVVDKESEPRKWSRTICLEEWKVADFLLLSSPSQFSPVNLLLSIAAVF